MVKPGATGFLVCASFTALDRRRVPQAKSGQNATAGLNFEPDHHFIQVNRPVLLCGRRSHECPLLRGYVVSYALARKRRHTQTSNFGPVIVFL
jgi:hypothetical protein